jgi:acetolactate synthase I/II/III large subunit
MHLVDSLGRCRRIQPVCMLHEQAAAIAAEAYARVTEDLGVVLVTSGPGGTNAITGIAGAWIESTPCLVISGQAKRSDLMGNSGVRQMGVQEVDIVSMVKPITKYAVTVTDPASMRYHLEKALFLARHGRPGPVWIDIPLDVQAVEIEPDQLQGFDSSELASTYDPTVLPGKVDRALEMINQSERPIVLAGNGVRLARAVNEFRQFVKELGLPVLTSRTNGLDLMPFSDSLYVGRPGAFASRGANFALQNSDCLLVLGCRLDPVQTGYDHANFARAARKIMVDIDPAEIGKMHTPIALAVQADVGDFLREALRQRSKIRQKDRSAWHLRCQDWKQKYHVVLPEHRSLPRYVSTYLFGELLSNELDANEQVVLCSSGAAIEIFMLAFQAKEGQRAFLTGGLGAMGFGLPAAIGACLAGNGKKTICIDGDGGFQLNIQELATLARLRLPVKIFILNNQGYASIWTMQRNHFSGRLVGADASSGLALPDLIRVARAYGLETATIRNHKGLSGKIRRLIDTSAPLICDVMIDPEEIRMPCVSTSVRPDGSLYSKPLEDLWPFLEREEFRDNMIIEPLQER